MTIADLKSLQYRHSSLATQLMYEPDRSIIEKIREHSKELRSAHLNINPSLSRGTDRVVLQSLTGSTAVNLTPQQAALQTNYYDDYIRDSAHEKREKYAIAKLEALLDYLTLAGARLSFFGIFSIARINLTDNDISKEDLLNAAIEFLGISNSLTGFAPYFDFSTRFSKVDNDCFANISVSWFEERTTNLPISIAPGMALSSFNIREWDMEVSNQGIEIRWDYNNKYALLAGKRNWTKNDYLSIAGRMFASMPSALENVRIKLEQAARSQGEKMR